MPVMMLWCCAPRMHMASMNCNIFRYATIVTLVTRVAHPGFFCYYCCVFLCFVKNSFQTIRAPPPPAIPGL